MAMHGTRHWLQQQQQQEHRPSLDRVYGRAYSAAGLTRGWYSNRPSGPAVQAWQVMRYVVCRGIGKAARCVGSSSTALLLLQPCAITATQAGASKPPHHARRCLAAWP